MLYFKYMDVKRSAKNVYLLFLVVIFLLSGFICPAIAVAEPDGYAKAKVELQRLTEDKKRGEYRHNWIKLADEFNEIYRTNANWNNRAAALYRSALSLEEMARRSFVRKDAQSAASRYEALAKNHAISPLADDSLYAAALIYEELLRDTKKAKALLKDIGVRYAKSDYAPAAKEYLATINGDAVASLASPEIRAKPVKAKLALKQISPQLRSDVVRIVLSISSLASWRAKYFENAINKQPGIIITLKDVAPSEKMSLEDEFKKSGIFTGYSVEYNTSNAQSTVILQFSDLACYTVKAEKEPARLIIEASKRRNALPAGITVGDKPKTNTAKAVPAKKPDKPVASKSASTESNAPHLNGNLAAQLGLSVKTIVIDPGHGGKDPGAMHHGLREKDINLDISKRLANVLRAAGYTVHLTRTTDVYLGLYERTDIARKHDADLFISIHANASLKPAVSGFETYFLDFTNDPETIRLAAIENAGVKSKGLGEMEKILGDMLLKARIAESRRLASMVQDNAIRKAKRDGFDTKNGGTRGAPFHVLIGASMPSILIEVGYSSNETEAKVLASNNYRDTLAEGIANGLHQYALQLKASK